MDREQSLSHGCQDGHGTATGIASSLNQVSSTNGTFSFCRGWFLIFSTEISVLLSLDTFFFELFGMSRNAWPWRQARRRRQLQKRFSLQPAALAFCLCHTSANQSPVPLNPLSKQRLSPLTTTHLLSVTVKQLRSQPALPALLPAQQARPILSCPTASGPAPLLPAHYPWNPSPLSFPYPPPLWPSLRWRKHDSRLQETNIASVSPGRRPGRRGCASILHFKLYLEYPSCACAKQFIIRSVVFRLLSAGQIYVYRDAGPSHLVSLTRSKFATL